MTRTTLAEVARQAGVSIGAASYAVNGQPGVSEATRARVVAAAERLGWVPHAAARTLSAGRSDAVGLVITRSARVLGTEPFFMELIAGMEAVMASRGCALLLQLATDTDAEIASHRRWAAQHRVDGVVVVDLRVDDPRVAALEALALPAVVAGDPSLSGGLPSVWSDDAGAVREVMAHLVAHGHRRLARVAGPAALGHVAIRARAAREAAREAGVDLEVVHTDFTDGGGAGATRDLLSRGRPDGRPTAITYDNDLMALAGLSVTRELGLSVPQDVSLVAGDDSVLCTYSHPALSAVGHDVAAYGSLLADRLFARLDAGSSPDGPDGQHAPAVLGASPALVVRASSGPAPS